MVAAAETDTIMINRHNQRSLRVLRTPTTERYEFASEGDPFKELMFDLPRLNRAGDMEVGFASLGQVTGRVGEILPIADIIQRTLEEFGTTLSTLVRHLA